MQQVFSTWIIAVTVAIIFSAMAGAILPDTGIKKYVTVVLGIVTTLIILSPLFSLFGADLQKEMDGALQQMDDAYGYEYDSALYKDYIFEVYMGDE